MVYLYNEMGQELDYNLEVMCSSPATGYYTLCIVSPNKVNLLSPIYMINKLHIAPTFKIKKNVFLYEVHNYVLLIN